MNGATTVAILPARGGSKRIPGKNSRPIDGIPVLRRTIELCQASGVFSDVVVSTDDSELAGIAEAAGARVPFERPASLADDHTGVLAVVRHGIQELGLSHFSDVACIYPTAVTMDPQDVGFGLETLRSHHDSVFVVSVTTFPYPVQRALSRDPRGRMALVDPETAFTRTQDLPERWHDAGQFIWATAGLWLEEDNVWARAVGHPVPRWRVADIDTEEDWEQAERLVRAVKP